MSLYPAKHISDWQEQINAMPAGTSFVAYWFAKSTGTSLTEAQQWLDAANQSIDAAMTEAAASLPADAPPPPRPVVEQVAMMQFKAANPAFVTLADSGHMQPVEIRAALETANAPGVSFAVPDAGVAPVESRLPGFRVDHMERMAVQRALCAMKAMVGVTCRVEQHVARDPHVEFDIHARSRPGSATIDAHFAEILHAVVVRIEPVSRGGNVGCQTKRQSCRRR